MMKAFPNHKYHINKQDFTISFEGRRTPQVWLCGVENNDRMEKVLGLGLNTIFLNECSQIGYKAFYTLSTRLAEKGKTANKLLLDANPPAQYHWTYKRYILGIEPISGEKIDESKFRVVHMNPTDNLININPEYIANLKKLPTYVQERYLHGKFAKGMDNAVFSKELETVILEQRLTKVVKQESIPVHAVFDIGVGDATAIWVCQFLPERINLLEYYEHNREALPYYINYLVGRRGYNLSSVVLPHDAKNKNWGTGRTIRESAEALGRQYKFGVHVLPDNLIADGINSARMLFGRIYFDKINTAQGWEALQNYEYTYSDKRGRESDKPLHNWASHGADAFRYMCMYYTRWNVYDPDKRQADRKDSEVVIGNGIGTFRDLMREKGIRI
jgi:hypothetical protein